MVSHLHNYTLSLNAAALVTFHDVANKPLNSRICQVMISTPRLATTYIGDYSEGLGLIRNPRIEAVINPLSTSWQHFSSLSTKYP